MSYTSLKGFNNINDTDSLTSLEKNIISFLDWGFLEKGAYTNVRLSQTDINSNDRSILRRTTHPNFTTGRVYESYDSNFVWESGITPNPPIQISGVYLNNVLKLPSDATYGHYVDYTNGRVIFNSVVPSSAVVKMEYSFKNILFTTAENVPILRYLQDPTTDLNSPNYSILNSGEWAIPSEQRGQLPVVAIESTNNSTYKGYQLGSQLQEANTDILIHIFAKDRVTAAKLGSFIKSQNEKTIFMYNIDMMVASGRYSLDYLGRANSGRYIYPDLVKDNNLGGFRYNKLRFTSANLQGPFRLGNYYHSVVRFGIQVLDIL